MCPLNITLLQKTKKHYKFQNLCFLNSKQAIEHNDTYIKIFTKKKISLLNIKFL